MFDIYLYLIHEFGSYVTESTVLPRIQEFRQSKFDNIIIFIQFNTFILCSLVSVILGLLQKTSYSSDD